MKSLKNHFSVILSLFVLLFSVQFGITLKKVIEYQNQNLVENYSIVIVSKKKLKLSDVKKVVSVAKSLEPISPKKILDRLKNDMSSKNLALLKIALPYFYSLKLTTFPSEKMVQKIKKSLLSLKGVTKVETFAKTHTKMFQMFQIFQIISYLFSTVIIVLSILLLFKQIRIWILEHEKRIKIMNYFGASFWMKSSFLYRLVIVDSIISAFLVSLLFIIAPNLDVVKEKADLLSVKLPSFNLLYDGLMLFGSSFILSVLIVTLVAKKMDGK